jgi:YesN/AraC family two-component response regulator
LTTLKKELGKTNDQLLQNIQILIDMKIQAIIDMGLRFSMDTKIRKLISNGNTLSENQRFEMFLLQRDYLQVYKIANPDIENIYICLPNQRYVFSTNNSFKIDSMPEGMSLMEAMGPNYWNFNLTGYYVDEFRHQVIYEGTSSRTNTVIYLRSIPWEATISPPMLLIVIMKPDVFTKTIHSAQWPIGSSITIFDRDWNPLISDGIATHGVTEDIRQRIQNNDFSAIKFHENTDILNSTRSALNGWHYVLTTPRNFYNDKLNDVANIYFVSILLSILIGFILSIFFVRKNYSPIKYIISLLAANGQKKLFDNKWANEYKFIGQSISNTISDKKLIEKRLNSQIIKQSENILYKLLSDGYTSLKTLNGISSNLFISDCFGVILIQHKCKNNEQNAPKLKAAINNILKNSETEKNYKYFLVEINSRIACLFNFDNLSAFFSESEIHLIVHEIFVRLKENYKLNSEISISNIHYGNSEIATAYHEAKEAMHYLNMIDIGSCVITYGDLLSKSAFHTYSIHKEQNLINSIKLGDMEQAEKIVDQILKNENLPDHMSPNMIHLLMVNITNTVIRLVREIYPDEGPESKHMISINKLISADTIPQYRHELSHVLTLLCREVNTNKDIRKVEYMNTISEYISKNSSDKRMNVAFVAGHFGLTLAYLSKKFKEAAGESILDYINKNRIESAKFYLKNSEISINQVAQMVGFTNTNTLIRIFKKYEGITPGKYKELTTNE